MSFDRRLRLWPPSPGLGDRNVREIPAAARWILSRYVHADPDGRPLPPGSLFVPVGPT